MCTVMLTDLSHCVVVGMGRMLEDPAVQVVNCTLSFSKRKNT